MARLLGSIAALPEDKQRSTVYEQWTVKEMLAHIAAWDRELVRGLDELLVGRRPALAGYGEADFNARVVEASRALPLDQVLAEFRDAHEALMDRIEALTDGQWELATDHRWSNGEPMTVASLFGYTYQGETHYGGHASEIERWAGLAVP
jgi:uncharacterized protein (TIGR03083 family)